MARCGWILSVAVVVATIGCRADAEPHKRRPAPARCHGRAPSETCYPPFANMKRKGSGEPAPAPPSSEYDRNGCLPPKDVTNDCCNAALDGPRFVNGTCCYHFCSGSCC